MFPFFYPFFYYLPCAIKEWLLMKFVASCTNVGNNSHNGFCPCLRLGPINAEFTASSSSDCSLSGGCTFYHHHPLLTNGQSEALTRYIIQRSFIAFFSLGNPLNCALIAQGCKRAIARLRFTPTRNCTLTIPPRLRLLDKIVGFSFF